MMPPIGEDYRSLAWKLCERRELPLLVTDMIAGYVSYQDLFTINLLSRSLNAQTNAIIYRDTVIDLDSSERSVKKASSLFRTLLTSETAAQAVRTLSLAGDPLHDWRHELSRIEDSESVEAPLRGKISSAILADLASFTRDEVDLYRRLVPSTRPPASEVSIGALCLQVLRLTEVQDLSVSSDYFRFPDFRRVLQDMALSPSTKHLQSCNLGLDLLSGEHRHASVVEDWHDALLTPFTLSNMQSIAIVASLKSEAVHRLRPSASMLTRLTLHHYQTHDQDLDALLAASPSLRYLNYHAMTDYGWAHSRRHTETLERSVGLGQLYDALHHVSDSLEELHTSHEFVEDSIHFSPAYAVDLEPLFRQRGEPSSLRRLHALTIPYASLLGWRWRTDVLDWDWDKVLPSSLRHLVLTDNLQECCFHDSWTDENLMPVISRLVQWLSAKRENEAAEFGLHIAQQRSEFNEPVRQHLTRMCAERGLRCSIDKVHPDRPKPAWRAHLPRGLGRGNLSRGRGIGRGMGRGA